MRKKQPTVVDHVRDVFAVALMLIIGIAVMKVVWFFCSAISQGVDSGFHWLHTLSGGG